MIDLPSILSQTLSLAIPIVGILDTNSDPTNIKFPIPGNDDARRSINLYCDLLKNTISDASKNIQVKEDKKEEKKKIEKKIEKNIKVKK